jgi:hypothetical protein
LQALEHSSVGAPFQHFLTPVAMLDRLAFGKKSPGRAGLYITVVRGTVQSLQFIASTIPY